MADREIGGVWKDKAANWPSLGHARQGAGVEAPQTAANWVYGPNSGRRCPEFTDLMAEGEGFEPTVRFSIVSYKYMRSLMNSEWLKKSRT